MTQSGHDGRHEATPAARGNVGTRGVTLRVPTAEAMRELGARVARRMRGGEVTLLSGPLGAGKTTFAQGFGEGLRVDGPVVSPTFTIARELAGRFADGRPARLTHVDAYRLGGDAYAPGQDVSGMLLDELESLGLDEEIDDPGHDTVVLMEWGEQMAAALAPDRLEVRIDRPSGSADGVPTSDGVRTVSVTAVGDVWRDVDPAGLADGPDGGPGLAIVVGSSGKAA